jgi:Carboxypeptidase regulatory-like domain
MLSGLAIFLLLAVPPQTSNCNCHVALESDTPKSANESVEYRVKDVRRIRGRVLYPNGEPVNEAVVEIYEHSGQDKNARSWEITASRTRRIACLTDRDGYYCFAGLPSGRYVLRIGTRRSEGINKAYIKLRLDRSWWRSWLRPGKTVEVRLSLGT